MFRTSIRNLSILKLSTLSQCLLKIYRQDDSHTFCRSDHPFWNGVRSIRICAILSETSLWYNDLSACQNKKNKPSQTILECLCSSANQTRLLTSKLVISASALSLTGYSAAIIRGQQELTRWWGQLRINSFNLLHLHHTCLILCILKRWLSLIVFQHNFILIY